LQAVLVYFFEMANEPKTAAHFLRRRDTWIRWVIENEDLDFSARVVGVHLAMRMNMRDQMAWPNVKTIAKSVGMSDRQARRAIAELEKENALYVARIDGRGSRYYLRFPW
jgi:hypothetical protein